MHLHPHIHTEIARDTQARRISEARIAATAAAAARRRADASPGAPAAGRTWFPALRDRFAALRQGA